jgi:hypothetical protein
MTKHKFLIIVLLAFISIPSFGQDYKFHRVYFYNFTKYIQWPESYNTAEFVIGVAGESAILESLNDMAKSKQAGGTQFKIVELNSKMTKLPQLNILYIPPTESGNLQKWKSMLKGTATLIVTEEEGMAKEGSMINFYLDNSKLKFEVNRMEAEKAGLKIASELLRFGREI